MKEIQNFIEERDELELRDLFAMFILYDYSTKNNQVNFSSLC